MLPGPGHQLRGGQGKRPGSAWRPDSRRQQAGRCCSGGVTLREQTNPSSAADPLPASPRGTSQIRDTSGGHLAARDADAALTTNDLVSRPVLPPS